MPFIPNDVVGGTAMQHAQASPDSVDFDILLAADSGIAIDSGLAVTPNNSGVSLNVDVAAGVVVIGAFRYTLNAVTNLTVAAADGTNPRFDLIVSSATTISRVGGTAASRPVLPALPASSAALAAIYIPAAATSITAANIVDKRIFYDPPSVGRIATKTGAYSAVAADGLILADAAAGGFTITLAPVTPGSMVTIKKVDGSGNVVTIAPASGLIDNVANDTLWQQWQARTYISDGVNWWKT